MKKLVYILSRLTLERPWATHRKYEVFESKHADLFGRPEVTVNHICFATLLWVQSTKIAGNRKPLFLLDTRSRDICFCT